LFEQAFEILVLLQSHEIGSFLMLECLAHNVELSEKSKTLGNVLLTNYAAYLQSVHLDVLAAEFKQSANKLIDIQNMN
jgi:hypothetical protein